MNKDIGRFHVLTDYHFQQRHSHADIARFAIEGGADVIQFRKKAGDIRHMIRDARETAAVCRKYSVPMLVNDRVDVALAVSADGVHLGQTDMPVRDARTIFGDMAIIGGTATTLSEAVEAEKHGADYIGFGPVFPTSSKQNPASVKGLAGLAEVADALSIPVIAIAGITAARVSEVLETGAYGVAVMTAVTLASDPGQAARDIREAIDASAGISPVVSTSNGRP